MPWIKEELCTGCGVCVEECPVGAIDRRNDGFAEIDEVQCIRCGRCHDVCPQEAVRHDGERIPQEVAENLRWVRKLLEHFHRSEEQAAFMQRMVRFFNKQKKVCQRTLAAIASAGNQPAADIDAAIAELSEGNDAQSSKG
jgi:ferredoxin